MVVGAGLPGGEAQEEGVSRGPMGWAPEPLVKVSESSRRAVGALSGFKEGRDRTMFAF